MSYSLFLWHEPVLRLLDALHVLPEPGTATAFLVSAALLLPCGLLAAWLSDRIVVRPCAKIASAFDERGRGKDYYEASPPATDRPDARPALP
ncbi:hypothetical protein P8605_20585 [Streptomyces sp. T-3]|nr:hypothetical protein [Streptomyces sp. T-3]